jgi:hypothetical protein
MASVSVRLAADWEAPMRAPGFPNFSPRGFLKKPVISAGFFLNFVEVPR